jgi:hypothetical protein
MTPAKILVLLPKLDNPIPISFPFGILIDQRGMTHSRRFFSSKSFNATRWRGISIVVELCLSGSRTFIINMSPSCETKMDNYRSAKEPYYKEGNSTSRHLPMLYFFHHLFTQVTSIIENLQTNVSDRYN